MDISTDDMARARDQMRAAWRAANPDAPESEMPAALQPEPRPHTGFLVALWLHPTTAAQLAVPGGEAAEALHVTLCYCGDPAEVADPDLTVARAISRVESLVSYRGPIEGVVAGYGRFAASDTSDGRDVFYAAIDIPGLESLRQEIAQELQWAGLPPRATHGFTPHCTLAYLDPAAANPVADLPALALRFAAITIMVADRRIDIPLRGFGPMLYNLADLCAADKPTRLFMELAQVPQ